MVKLIITWDCFLEQIKFYCILYAPPGRVTFSYSQVLSFDFCILV